VPINLDIDKQKQCLVELRCRLKVHGPNIDFSELVEVLIEFDLDKFPLPFFLLSPIGAQGDEDFTDGISPLFDSTYYKALNKDIIGDHKLAWWHYQVFGVVEGRSPSPLLEVSSLKLAMPLVSLGAIIDEYLLDSKYWEAIPSRLFYHDVLTLDNIPSNENPSEHLLTCGEHFSERATSRMRSITDLMLESCLPETYLMLWFSLVKNLTQGEVLKMDVIKLSEFSKELNNSKEVLVAPGSAIASPSRRIISNLGTPILSEDGSTFTRGPLGIAIATGRAVSTDVILVLTVNSDLSSLINILKHDPTNSYVIAPATHFQVRVLKHLVDELESIGMEIDVLDLGNQVRVNFKEIIFCADLKIAKFRRHKLLSQRRSHNAILLSISNPMLNEKGTIVEEQLAFGAKLLDSDKLQIGLIALSLKGYKQILCTESESSGASLLVKPSKIRHLPEK
jgi:hypothetical protein